MKYRDASIEVVLNGFIVTIGCQRVVAESPESLKKMIGDYLDNPKDTEKRFQGNAFNGIPLVEQPQAPQQERTIGLSEMRDVVNGFLREREASPKASSSMTGEGIRQGAENETKSPE